MKNKKRVTSEQITEALKAFGGVIHHLPPEVELHRSSVGFKPSQTTFEEIAGFRDVKVELLEREESTPPTPAGPGPAKAR